MEEPYKDSKMFYRKANEIRKPYKPKTAIIKNENNELIIDEKSIAEEFKRVFQEMLDEPEYRGSKTGLCCIHNGRTIPIYTWERRN